jgi:hypothetical protein
MEGAQSTVVRDRLLRFVEVDEVQLAWVEMIPFKKVER